MRFELLHNDTECFQETLYNLGFHGRVLQTSPGNYRRFTQLMILPSLVISQHRQSACPRLFHGIFSFDEFLFCLPTRYVPTHVNGLQIGAGGLCVICPGEAVHIPADFAVDSVHIVIKRQKLCAYFKKEHLDQIQNNPLSIRCKPSSSEQFFYLKHKIIQYITKVVSSHVVFNLQSIMDIQETICGLLSHMLLELVDDKPGYHERYNSRLAIVRRATEYIDSQSRIDVGKGELLQHAFCSVRSLEYAFNSILGLSPKKYLKLRRMHLIKKELKHAKGKAIKEVLDRHGVINQGRFSRDFHALFGVYPNDLARNQSVTKNED